MPGRECSVLLNNLVVLCSVLALAVSCSPEDGSGDAGAGTEGGGADVLKRVDGPDAGTVGGSADNEGDVGRRPSGTETASGRVEKSGVASGEAGTGPGAAPAGEVEPTMKEEKEEGIYDPTPLENPTVEAATAEKAAPAVPAPLDVEPFKTGQDPFESLKVPQIPVVDQADPRSDVLRLGPEPPPEPGEVVAEFPPPDAPAPPIEIKVADLSVVRHSPDGETDLVDTVTVSFNQPMVPLAAISDQDLVAPPMSIEPTPQGRFVWVGSDTIAFQAKGRMPFATEYTVTVPAGVESALGKKLAAPFSFKLTTPRPAVAAISPHEDEEEVEPGARISITFTAPISPEVAAKHVTLKPLRSEEISLTAGPGPEVEKPSDNPIIRAQQELDRSRTVLLTPNTPLPVGTQFLFEIDGGLTSTDGPLPMGKAQVFSFSTYYPPVVRKITCWEHGGKCYPGSPISVELNNTLKKQKVDHLVAIAPKPDGLSFRVAGNQISIYGEFLPGTTYTVSVSPGIVDVHGQKTTSGALQKLAYGEASPFLRLARSGIAIAEAVQPHDFTLSSLNITTAHVTLAGVSESNLATAANWVDDWHRHEDPLPAGLSLAVDKDVKLQKEDNRVDRNAIDLDQALSKAGHGLVLVDVRARIPRGLFSGWNELRQSALVQVTNLGLTAVMSDSDLVVMVTSLDAGKPVAGAHVRLVRSDGGKEAARGETDQQGIVRLPGPRKSETFGPYFLIAGKGDDLSFLRLTGYSDISYISSYAYFSSYEPEWSSVFHVVSERGLYRPGEEAFFNVIARNRKTGPQGDIEPLPSSEKSLWYTVTDPRGNDIGSGTVPLSAFGTGTLTVTTKKDAPLGYYSVRVSGSGGTGYGGFQVEEYRAAEYEVSASFLHRGENMLVRRTLDAEVTGNYFFGAPMANAQVEWRLERVASHYAPPGNPGMSFGDIDPEERYRWFDWDWRGAGGPQSVSSGSGALDGAGTLTFPVTLDPGDLKRSPVSFTLEAEVFDQNRQSIAARSTIVAHRAERYVGMALDRTLLAAGEPVEVSAVVTRLDGTRYPSADVVVTLHRCHYESVEEVGESGDVTYETKYTEEKVATCTLKAGAEPGRCSLRVPAAGEFVARAETFDLAGRPARGALSLYAWGETEEAWVTGQADKVELVLDRKEYAPGDTAKVFIRSPFPDAVGMIVVAREGIASAEQVVVANGSALFELKVEDNWLPSVGVHVGLVRGRTQEPGKTKDDRGRPSWAKGSTTIPVARDGRKIRVAVAPASPAVEPGGSLTVEVTAVDAAGAGVKAGVALMVVDEGVLSLIGYATPDPMGVLYAVLQDKIGLADSRPLVVPRSKPKAEFEQDRGKDAMAAPPASAASPAEGAPGGGLKRRAAKMELEEEAKKADEGGAPGDDEAGPAFALRQFFKSTAYFNAALETDETGKLSVEIKMPDNLTEFRIMALAADRSRLFGSSDAQVRTRKPLVVRPALPRFLNVGDLFEASAVVNNETGFDTQVMVRCAAANAVVEGPVQVLDVKAGEAKEFRFKAAAGNPGPATFQFAAVALTKRRDTDAVETTIPTLMPATSEATAAYGVVEDAVRQPLKPPSGAFPGYGGLDVSLSSTALTGLQDAVSYLFDYQYECTEQICSRVLPIIALGDVIADFKLGKARSADEAKELVKSGIAELLLHQRGDGGFGYWPGSTESWLYVSAYAAMTLDAARARGFEVPQHTLDRVAGFLEQRLDAPHDWEVDEYSSQAMAVLVLARLSRHAPGHADRLYRLAIKTPGPGERPGYSPLPMYAKAWLMEAIWLKDAADPRGAELHRQIANAAVETASAIHFSETRTESLKLMMHSEDRTDAIVLGALLAVKSDDPMIEKLVRGLMRSRVQGHWSTTQANAYALLAMSRYYEMFEKEVPDFTARIWHGATYLLGRKFKGRSMDIVKTRVPMEQLLKDAAGDLIVAKKGNGRLYYRLGLKYALPGAKVSAEDRGFGVERTYLAEGKDSTLRRLDDGTWVAKAGSYVRIKLRVVASDRRYYVAVVDPLPAGLEAVNERLVTSATTRVGGSEQESWQTGRNPWYWWHWNPWDYEEKRDDRLQIFCDRMYGGVYEYTYTARATTIGTFVVPPTRAEEMYEPETFGRSSSQRFVVEP